MLDYLDAGAAVFASHVISRVKTKARDTIKKQVHNSSFKLQKVATKTRKLATKLELKAEDVSGSRKRRQMAARIIVQGDELRRKEKIVRELNEQNGLLLKQILVADSMNSALVTDLEQTRQKLQDVATSVESQGDTIQLLQSEVNSVIIKSTAMDNATVELQHKLTAVEQEKATLQQQLQTTHIGVEQMKLDVAEMASKHCADVAVEAELLETELQSAQETSKKLAAQLNLGEADKALLRKTLLDKQSKFVLMHDGYVETTIALQNSTSAVQALEEQLRHLEALLTEKDASHEALVSNFQRQISNNQDTVAELQQEVTQLEFKLTAAEHEANGVQSKADAAEHHALEHADLADKRFRRIKQLMDELEALKMTKIRVDKIQTQELNKLRGDCSTLPQIKEQLKASQSSLCDTQGKLKTKASQLSAALKNSKAVKNELEETKMSLLEAKSENQILKQEKAREATELEEAKKSLLNAELENQILKERKACEETEVESTRQAEAVKLQQRLSSLRFEVDSAEMMLKAAKKQAEDIEDEEIEVRFELDSVKEQLEAAKSDLAAVPAPENTGMPACQLLQLEQDYSRLYGDHMMLQEYLNDLQYENEQLKQNDKPGVAELVSSLSNSLRYMEVLLEEKNLEAITTNEDDDHKIRERVTYQEFLMSTGHLDAVMDEIMAIKAQLNIHKRNTTNKNDEAMPKGESEGGLKERKPSPLREVLSADERGREDDSDDVAASKALRAEMGLGEMF